MNFITKCQIIDSGVKLPKNFAQSFGGREKEKGGVGQVNVARLLCRAERGMGWEAALFALAKGQSPQKYSF